MTDHPSLRAKISVSLPTQLIARIDDRATEMQRSRSGAIAVLLEQALLPQTAITTSGTFVPAQPKPVGQMCFENRHQRVRQSDGPDKCSKCPATNIDGVWAIQ